MNDAPARWRWWALLSLAIAAVLVPFAIWGAPIEAAIAQWRTTAAPRWWVASTIVALLTADVLLPIPSSLVAVAGGMLLGAVVGTLAGALGLTLGCVLGWSLARAVGPAGVVRIVGRSGLDRLRALTAAYGGPAVLAMRAVPVMAEISVVAAGAGGMSLRRLLAMCVPANLAIAGLYAVAGEAAVATGWSAAGLVVGLAGPAMAMVWASGRLRATPRARDVVEPAKKA